MKDAVPQRRRKVMYVESNIDGTVGGSYFSLYFLIEALNRRVYEPVVVFYRDNYVIPRYRAAGCKVYVFKRGKPINVLDVFPRLKQASRYPFLKYVVLMPSQAFQKAFNYLFAFVVPSLKCLFMLRKEKVDLIHLNNTLSRPLEWMLASTVLGIKVVAHERGINKDFSARTRHWAQHLSAIICISNAVKSNLEKAGFPEDKLIRIYNGLDPEKFVALKSREVVLRELGIDDGSPLIGIVGNIKKWKGQEVVIRALKRIKESNQNVRCLVVGDVSRVDQRYRDHLEALIRKEHLEDTVVFTGPREDVADVVNCLSVLIHASVEPEPFGRILLEGMALRKPVISTRIGAPVEIVLDGKTGVLVAPGDPEELAWAVLKILSDPVLAQEMGNAGYERLVTEFSVKKNCEQTEDLYARVLGLVD